MELQEKSLDGVLVIAVIGRLTADCAVGFKHQLGEAIARNRRIVLDLNDMEYIDSTGLGAMVFVLQKLTDEGGRLNLARIKSKPRMVFNITKVYKLFDIFDTVEEAVGAMNV